MNLSQLTHAHPPGIAFVALLRDRVGEFEIFAEEEQLSSPTAASGRLAEFRLGRRAAHLAMQEIGYEAQPVLRGPGREPIWPEGLAGSIAHSGDLAIAAVGRRSDTGGIGIDLEERARYFPGLEEEIAGDEERAALDRLDGQTRQDATLEIFSAKESIYKAHYPRVGRFFGFEAARVELASDHVVGYFTEVLDPSYPTDRPMRIDRVWLDDVVVTWLVLPPD